MAVHWQWLPNIKTTMIVLISFKYVRYFYLGQLSSSFNTDSCDSRIVKDAEMCISSRAVQKKTRINFSFFLFFDAKDFGDWILSMLNSSFIFFYGSFSNCTPTSCPPLYTQSEKLCFLEEFSKFFYPYLILGCYWSFRNGQPIGVTLHCICYHI